MFTKAFIYNVLIECKIDQVDPDDESGAMLPGWGDSADEGGSEQNLEVYGISYMD